MCEFWKRNWEAAFNERLTDFVAMQLKGELSEKQKSNRTPRAKVWHIFALGRRANKETGKAGILGGT